MSDFDTTRDALALLLDGLLGDPERDTATREFLARETAEAILAEFLLIPRSAAPSAAAQLVVQGDQPGELVSVHTFTNIEVDVSVLSAGTRAYLRGHATTTDNAAIEALFEPTSSRPLTAWLAWGSEYLRVTGFARSLIGPHRIEFSQATPSGFAVLNGRDTSLLIVEPSPPRPPAEWLLAERDRAIRDLVGDGQRPSVLVPGADGPDGGLTLIRHDPWSAAPLPEDGAE